MSKLESLRGRSISIEIILKRQSLFILCRVGGGIRRVRNNYLIKKDKYNFKTSYRLVIYQVDIIKFKILILYEHILKNSIKKSCKKFKILAKLINKYR